MKLVILTSNCNLTVSLNFLVNGLVVGIASFVPIKSSIRHTVKKTACSNCKQKEKLKLVSSLQ